MKLLVTGGSGFIGSHFIAYSLKQYPEVEVTNLDLMTYAAHPDTAKYLASLAPSRYRFVQGDIASPDLSRLFQDGAFDAVVNFAAETHVDRSILEPAVFVLTNIKGVDNLLTLARKQAGVRFLQVSTDEVYGSLAPHDPAFTETTPLAPNSPYAASKASADLLCLANHRTYGQDIVITRCSNNYGPFQFPEKFIPLMIANALEDLPIPIYGDGRQVRDWIYVEDHARAVDMALRHGKSGEIYNVGASHEKPNIEMAKMVLAKLSKPESLLKHVGDRPAHDRRYGINSEKIRRELGWEPKQSFESGLEQTIRWYKENTTWWKKLRGTDYQKYYAANYDAKFGKKAEPGRNA